MEDAHRSQKDLEKFTSFEEGGYQLSYLDEKQKLGGEIARRLANFKTESRSKINSSATKTGNSQEKRVNYTEIRQNQENEIGDLRREGNKIREVRKTHEEEINKITDEIGKTEENEEFDRERGYSVVR